MITIKGVDKWILPIYKNNLLDYNTRITVLYGGAGSGKSYYGVQKMIIKALQSKRKVLVIRKIQATIKDSIFALFNELLLKMPQVIKIISVSDMKITLVNGSVFVFKGLDDPEKIKSIQGITDIIIEEASELTLDDFTQLNLRLRANVDHLQMTLMFNPVSKANWTYAYFFENGAPDNCKIIHTTYKDNPTLPQVYIDSLLEMEKRNKSYFKIYALGEFATLNKLVYPTYSKDIFNDAFIADLKKSAYFWCGLDFGYVNDPSALVWGFYDPNGQKLYITGEYVAHGLTNDLLAQKIKDLGLSKEKIVADSAEQKSIAELRNFGITRIISAAKGHDSIVNGIDKVNRCDIHVDERCHHVIEELENYCWQKDRKTDEYINKPVDSFNHCLDALRYGIQTVINKKSSDLNYIPLIG